MTNTEQQQPTQANPMVQSIPLASVPQGAGSNLDADTTDGFNASPKPMPHCLIPLDATSKFPTSVIPSSGGGGSGFLLGNGAPTDKNILIADGTLWQSRTMSGDAIVSVDTGVINVTSVAHIVTGVLAIINGGTNSNTALSGSSIMVSDGTHIVQGTAGTTTTVLHGNASGSPTYGSVSLTADITGILGVVNGGTGTSTVFTTGSIIFAGSSGIYSQDNSNLFWDASNKNLKVGHYVGLGTPSFSVYNGTWASGVLVLQEPTYGGVLSFQGPAYGNSSEYGQTQHLDASGNFLGGFVCETDSSGRVLFVFEADGRHVSASKAIVRFDTTTNSTYNSGVLLAVDTKVAIGTNNTFPNYTLDVGGDINTSGIYRVSGSQIAFSNIAGTLGLAAGGTNANLSATGGTSQVLKQSSSGASITVGQLASSDLSDVSTLNVKTNTIGHFSGYFRTETGLTLPTTFLTTTIDAAVTIKRITVDPVVASVGTGTGTVFRLTDGTTNCNVTLGPGASNATATFSQNYASGTTLSLKVQSDDNATPPTDINVVIEYIIQ